MVFLANGYSLSSENILQELEEELESINWDILWLCKLRIKGEEKINHACGYLLYESGTEDGKTSSVRFLSHKMWKNYIIEYDSASDKVARLVIQMEKRCELQIIIDNVPTISYTDEEFDDFYEEAASTNQNGNSDKLIMED